MFPPSCFPPSPQLTDLGRDLEGRVEVIDGDTISLDGPTPRIRLYGIDAPESRQTCETAAGAKFLCGSRSADALQELVGRNGRALCQQTDRDRYGRIVAVCTVGGKDLSAEFVRGGWAVEFCRYSDAVLVLGFHLLPVPRAETLSVELRAGPGGDRRTPQ